MKIDVQQYAAALVDLLPETATEAEVKSAIAGFVRMLARRNALGAAPRIVAAVERLLDKRAGIVRGTVQSAHTLTDESAQAAGMVVKELMSATDVRLEAAVDETLLGGFIVEGDDYRIDASVRGRLESLRKELAR